MQKVDLNHRGRLAKIVAAGLMICGLATAASAILPQYTREQLQLMTKEELIGIVLYLQGGQPGGNCERFDLNDSKVGSIITRLNNPGYSNNGTLRWPSGQTFLLRNNGYSNDRTLYYPNGQILRLANSGYSNNQTVYWPNGKVMRLANSGYSNDGSIFHTDGSSWLLRNRGYSNDKQRSGAPTDQSNGDGFSVSGRLTSDDAIYAVTTVSGSDWTVHVYTTASAIDRGQDEIFYDECF